MNLGKAVVAAVLLLTHSGRALAQDAGAGEVSMMTIPYGSATFGERTVGGNLRYSQRLGQGWELESVTGYAYTRSQLLDVDDCAYDRFGRCLLERRPGEIEPGNPRDTLNWEHAVYSRNQLSWELLPDQNLVLGISPSFATRTGDERQQSDPGARDPLEAQRELFTLVNGLEYGVSLFEDRLESRAFVNSIFSLPMPMKRSPRTPLSAANARLIVMGLATGFGFASWTGCMRRLRTSGRRVCRVLTKCSGTTPCPCLISY